LSTDDADHVDLYKFFATSFFGAVWHEIFSVKNGHAGDRTTLLQKYKRAMPARTGTGGQQCST
jgi:hypothetical protein